MKRSRSSTGPIQENGAPEMDLKAPKCRQSSSGLHGRWKTKERKPAAKVDGRLIEDLHARVTGTKTSRRRNGISNAWTQMRTARDIVEEDIEQRRIHMKMMRAREVDAEDQGGDVESQKEKTEERKVKEEKKEQHITKARGFLLEKEDPEKSSEEEEEGGVRVVMRSFPLFTILQEAVPPWMGN